MRRDDERNPVIQFGEDAAEMAVPSVTMNDVGVDVGGVKVDVTLQRAENRLQRFRASEVARIELVSLDLEAAFFEILIPETTNIDIDGFRQLAREITNVHAGAARSEE